MTKGPQAVFQNAPKQAHSIKYNSVYILKSYFLACRDISALMNLDS